MYTYEPQSSGSSYWIIGDALGASRGYWFGKYVTASPADAVSWHKSMNDSWVEKSDDDVNVDCPGKKLSAG
jgi:hypothetical protein